VPEIDWDVIKNVLAEYNVDVIDIKTESYKKKKGVWWIRTPDGNKILKKHSNSKETIEYILAAVKYLQNRGIHIPQIIETINYRKYVYMDGYCYILSQAVYGKNPSYNSQEELKSIVQELAKFHKASTGFIPPSDSKPRIHLGSWLEDHGRKLSKLKSFYLSENSNEEHTHFGRMILKEFPYFCSRIENSIKGLEKSGYHQWVNDAGDTGGLCHQDFAAGNLVLTGPGEMYVLDTDSITIDIPIRDIRKLLLKVMKKRGGWNADLTGNILTWYQAVNPLEPWQWQILKYELIYPHLFSGIMSKYYEKREKSWTQEKYLKRLKEMIIIEKSVKPIIGSFDALIPSQY